MSESELDSKLDGGSEEMVTVHDFRLKIWMVEREVDHDGYCSDPGTPKYTTEEKAELIPIPDELPDDAISKNGAVDIDHLSHLNARWSHGNGYCGMKSKRTVTRAMIVNDKKYESGELEVSFDDGDDYIDDYQDGGYESDEEYSCKCICNCRRRCRCICNCRNIYDNRIVGRDYLSAKQRQQDWTAYMELEAKAETND